MTWFAHRCWFCGHKSKAVVFIVGDANFQCVDRATCEQRRRDKGAVGLVGLDSKLAKSLGYWS